MRSASAPRGPLACARKSPARVWQAKWRPASPAFRSTERLLADDDVGVRGLPAHHLITLGTRLVGLHETLGGFEAKRELERGTSILGGDGFWLWRSAGAQAQEPQGHPRPAKEQLPRHAPPEGTHVFTA